MAKKNFSEGIDAIMGGFGKNAEEVHETRQSSRQKEKAKKAETRTTLAMDEELIEKVKALAYWERSSIKDIISEALLNYIDSKGEKYVKEALNGYKRSLNKE